MVCIVERESKFTVTSGEKNRRERWRLFVVIATGLGGVLGGSINSVKAHQSCLLFFNASRLQRSSKLNPEKEEDEGRVVIGQFYSSSERRRLYRTVVIQKNRFLLFFHETM